MQVIYLSTIFSAVQWTSSRQTSIKVIVLRKVTLNVPERQMSMRQLRTLLGKYKNEQFTKYKGEK